MKPYFQRIYSVESLSDTSDNNNLAFFVKFWNYVAEAPSSNSSDSVQLSPIVYFNVDNEVSILRSTVLRSFLNSQLAIRVSRRWKEQENSGNIDQEGNLIISTSSIHPTAFRDILFSLRIENLQENQDYRFTVFVQGRSSYFLDETLDYLGISSSYIVKAFS
jgi:hypothetical protein